MDEITLVFLEESRDNIEKISDNLLILERNTEDMNVLNELFRATHTLKGMFATMEFESFAELTHKMEDLMDRFRNNEEVVTTEKIDILLRCVNVIDEMIVEYEHTGAIVESDIQKYIDLLENKDDVDEDEKNIANSRNEKIIIDVDEPMKEVHVEINEVEMKSVKALIFLNNIEESLNIVNMSPSKESIISSDGEDISNNFIITVDDNITNNEIKEIIIESAKRSDDELIKDVNIRENDIKLENKVNTKEIKSSVAVDIKENINKINTDDKSDTYNKKNGKNDNNTKINQIVRIESSKIDSLMNLVAEMVTEKNRLELRSKQLNDETLIDSVDRVDRIISNIQDIIMKVRMIEMEKTFNIFPREISKICKKLNKKVNLTIEGGDTELDRTVVDQIKNPLVHIIKNSLDHGIEMPEDRLKNGKPEEGNLLIKAQYEGNQVVITVADDGKGISGEHISAKAIEKGLVTKEQVERMSDDEKVNLICMPGFSTAAEVTELSGRGVGLDAVKTFIQNLNGSLEIESVEGKGTTIKLYVPLTMAIIQSMLVNINKETFAIPLYAIESIVDSKDVEYKKANNKEVMVYKNITIPIIHLSDVVKSERKESEEEFIVFIRKAGKLYAMMVHEVIGQQEIVIKNLGEHLNSIKEYSGATILGDGSVALILDIMNCINLK